MNYKKEKNENYNLHLIKTDRFKEIIVSLRFTKKYNKEEGAYLKLLERVLATGGTKKHKTLKEIAKELENLYRTNGYCRFFATSKNMTFEMRLTMINPKYTEMSIYEDAFKLFNEVITSPNVKNNEWEKNTFELEKENLIKSIKNVKDSPETYGRIKFEEQFYKGTIYEENNYKNLKIFESLENKKLYETYKKLFNEYKIDVFVIGDYEEEIIKKQVAKLLNNFNQKDTSLKDLKVKLKTKEEAEEIKEKIDTTQSNLFVGCTLTDITDEERNYALVLYNTILGTMNNSVLFVNVREKNSLCYHIGSLINKYTDTIVIDSGIDAKNYKKAMKLIEESLNSMTKESVIKKLITNAKKTLDIAYNDFYDNILKIIDFYYLNEFSYFPSIEERRKKINEITPKEICNLAKKVHINCIYLLEGSSNEEN